MRSSSRSGLILVQMITLMMLMSGLADSYLYTWEDETGVAMYSNDRTLAPDGVQVKVLFEWSAGQEASEILATGTEKEKPAGETSTVITQGEFAVHLARELGFDKDLTSKEAAEILSSLRIAPSLGHWEVDAAMTPKLTSRLRALTVAAPQMGWIAITPEEALFAFDSAAALLGVPIPVDLDTEVREFSPPEVAVPALVYVTPPPYLIAPYYTWVPVSGGFLWHGTRVRGFFALHSVHLNTHHFNSHRFSFGLHFVRRHFLHHLTEHHPVRRHTIHRPLRHTVRHFTRSFTRPSHRIRHRHRDLRNHLHSRRFDRHGIQDRKHVIRHRTARARHHLVARRFIPSVSHILTAPHTNIRHRVSLQRHSRRGRHRSASARFGVRHGRGR